jgi:non-specific serine/threonine protein kinase/serine/threonine-protein kinase
MDERSTRLEELFDEASELGPAARRAFVDGLSGADAALADELAALLAADSDAPGFLDAAAVDPAGFGNRGEVPDVGLRPGQRVGSYEILHSIASGGMGTVYAALQDQPRREVALKVLRAGLDSPSAVRRFQYEAEVLGRLSHPGIAKIYEAGTWREGEMDFPYFAMEFVRGARTLVEYADQERLPTRARFELFGRVCDAVQHGHQRGVIHRDLKPANVLVDEAGEPRVIDFGIARAVDPDQQLTTAQTGVGQLLGTLQYMSPEQCEADPAEVDTRSDVYALGLVLYELLCGRPPYDVSGVPLPRAVEIVQCAEPRPPSTVVRALRGDAETVVLKALHKDRERRYASPSDLAADVRRFLAGDPIEAKRDSGWYVLRKTLRRHRLPVAGATTIAGLLVVGLVGSTTLLQRTRAQRDRAETAEAELEVRIADVSAARDEAHREAAKFEATAGFFGDVLSSVHPMIAQGRDTALLREIFDEASRKVDAELADAPAVRASVQAVLGNSYQGLGLYEQAERLLSASVDTYRDTVGLERPEAVDAMGYLAHVWLYQDRVEESEELIRETLRTIDAIPPEDFGSEALAGLARADMLNNLATLVGGRGDLDEAEDLLREALTITHDALGKRTFDSIRVAHNFARLLREQRKWVEAEALYSETLEISLELLGEKSPATIYLLEGSVVPLIRTGRMDEAEERANRAVALSREVYGDGQLETLNALGSLGQTLGATERWDEALPIFRERVEAMARLVPPGHSQVALCRSTLGRCLSRLERYEEAELELLAAQRVFDSAPPHPALEGVHMDLVELYDAWGRPEERERFRARLR